MHQDRKEKGQGEEKGEPERDVGGEKTAGDKTYDHPLPKHEKRTLPDPDSLVQSSNLESSECPAKGTDKYLLGSDRQTESTAQSPVEIWMSLIWVVPGCPNSGNSRMRK